MTHGPEYKVKVKVGKALATLPKMYRFMPVQRGLGAATLDYLICAGGWFISIETKAKGKKLTPRQEITKAEIEAADGLVFVVDDDESLNYAMDRIRACCLLANEIRKPTEKD
jgi:hypothetical protein